MLGPWPFVVAALAAARLTQFFVFDTLMGAHPDSGSRFSVAVDRFAYWGQIPAPEGYIDGDDRSFWRGKIGDLLTCPFCLGFWISAACYLAVVVYEGTWGASPLWVHVLSIFAVAGLQALANGLTRS